MSSLCATTCGILRFYLEFFFQKFALTNVHHFDLSEKQDSCGNHPEEAEYDEYHDQIG